MEDEVLDKPVEDTSDNFDKDIADTLAEALSTEDNSEVVEPSVNEEVETKTEVSGPTETEDYSPLLNKLTENIKFMDKEVKFESVDEAIKTLQKGLNYERLEEKNNKLENDKALLYVREKAKALGMTTDEYIKAVEDYEVKQETEKQEEELNAMITNGIPEEMAKKIIETNQVAKTLQKEKNELKQKEQIELAKKQEEDKFVEFAKTFPDVVVKDIPREVFIEAEKSDLVSAYTKYENTQLKKQVEILKKNNANANSSPVKGTTEHGGVEVGKKNAFLSGFED